MAQASKTFRIFVSSTFSDLKEERNALQKEVFPKLRELCMQHGCRFQAIDLRWGVREEAALDQQTMKICLEEIARCQRVTPRPNFIVLLGDRYGWRPLPAEIPADEFEEILRCLPTDETERQRRHILLNQWYRRDDNAVPAVYCLLPREGEFKNFDKWEAVERELRSILLEAIDGMLLAPEQRLKYLASATEQEIAQAVLRVPDAREHVFCFFRTIKNLPLDKSAKDFVDLVEVNGAYRRDTQARDRLERLKNRELRERLPGNIHDYEAEWTSSGITTDHIAKLCKDVYRSLSRIITEEITRIEKVDPLEQEQAAHEAFGRERAKFFVGRADILQTIADYVKGGDHHPLAVFGASGSGKSALMAKAIAECGLRNADCVMVSRFIGATPNSSDGRALLEGLCREISHRYGADETTIPMDYRELVQEFPKWLALATTDKPLIVFIDALDQLSDVEHARNLAWLPAELPEHVRLIVSTLPGECMTALERKRPRPNLIELEPMSPAEGSNLLDLWLKDTGRTLQNRQRRKVLSKFARNGLPLYLKLAFEEARRWKSYTADIVLKPDILGIIRDNLFARLSSDANHGPTLVSHSLGYLAAAKNGLSEDELLDVLSLDKKVFQDFMDRAHHEPPEKRLPVVVWSRLYFDLEPYLTERTANGSSLTAFYHRQLGEVVAEEYLAGDAKRERHRSLARYFGDQPLQIEKDRKKTPNVRKVSELPYQQTHGEMWPELEETLTGFSFAMTKCAASMIYELLSDYQTAVSALPEEKKGALKIWEAFFRERLHILAQGNDDWPSNWILLQLAMEHADDSPVSQAAELWLTQDARDWTWLRRKTRPAKLPSQACLASVVVRDAVVDLAVDQCASEAVVLTGHYDVHHNSISHWMLVHIDLRSLEILRQEEIPLRPTQPLTEILKSPPAKMVQLTQEAPDRIQKLAILALRRVGFHNPELTRQWESVALLEDGRRIITGTHDGVVRIWDLNALQQTSIDLQGDLEARNAIDQARQIWESSGEQLWGKIRKIADLEQSLCEDFGFEFDLENPADDATLRTWDWMNRGLKNIAFRYVSLQQLNLIERSSKRLIAAWISSIPLTEPDYDNVVASASFYVRAVRTGGCLAVETTAGTATLLEVLRGNQVVDLESLDDSLPPSLST